MGTYQIPRPLAETYLNGVPVVPELRVTSLTATDLTAATLLVGSAGYGQIKTSADDGVMIAVANGSNQGNRNLIVTDYANRAKDHDHATSSTNPTLFVHSATDPDSDNTQWVSISHNATDGVITAGKGSLRNVSACGASWMQYCLTLADDAEVGLPAAVTGTGAVVSINAQFGSAIRQGLFGVTLASGVSVLNAGSGSYFAAADTDGLFCIYDAGAAALIKNRLGGTTTVLVEIVWW